MLIGKIHFGSGLGDQLFSYITTRVRALELGVDFGFVGIENFKGKDFMQLDWGAPVNMQYHTEMPSGRLVIDEPHNLYVLDKPYYDPEFNFIPDSSVIDGCYAQDEKYFGQYLPQIRKWLQVEPLELPDNLCVINFRGGEFKSNPDLFLTKAYWQEAIKIIEDKYLDRAVNPIFEVHTDDPISAKELFPDYKIIKDIGLNWRSVRFAKHVIVSNSAFGVSPALLNEDAQEIIAPRRWARRNLGKEWSMPQNYYRKFQYI